MAFKESRNPCNKSTTHEFDIERFAYNVFAYMLRMCGFPDEKIVATRFKVNTYKENDFVMNAGLSALPIALCMRDNWRCTFERRFREKSIRNMLQNRSNVESFIVHSGELEENETLSKIQFSLALYNEYSLFLNFKDIETDLDTLSKLWSHLCKHLVEKSKDSGITIESALTTSPDVSESWISNFIRNFGIPYGSSTEVSYRFIVHTGKCHIEGNIFSEEMSTEDNTDVITEKPLARASDISDGDKVTFPDGSNLESDYVAGKCCHNTSSDEMQVLEESALVETEAHSSHRNGLNYVIERCLKRQKRGRTQSVEVVDALEKLNLGKEVISPVGHDTKRRRKMSG